MNIYDFDGTIYNGDSCKDIVIYGLKKYPSLTIQSLKKARILNRDYKRGYIQFERVKEELLSFIFKIDDRKKFISDFVDSHLKKIKPWYKSRMNVNDVIVSASYDIWIGEFARKLGLKYIIGTRVDAEGKILGLNCKGEEKVKRINAIFNGASINCCYSDSSVDIPLLELGKTAYVVEGNKLITYRKGYKFKNNK